MHFFPEIAVWIFLSFAIIAIVINKNIWIAFLSLSMAFAFFYDILELKGILIILSGIVLAYYSRTQNGWRLYLIHFLLLAWALLLALHLFPGFNNLKVIDNAVTGIHSTPFNMSLNIDKPMLIFAFILLLPGMLVKHSSPNKKKILSISIIGLVTLPLLGYVMGVIKPEMSVPSWIWLFALNNLLITCAAEEVFFRGYLQNILSRFGNFVALSASSLLFGLAHFSGGISIIIIATIAGAFYGAIYYATGRLYIAIIAHFLFNMYHLIVYTYPVSNSM